MPIYALNGLTPRLPTDGSVWIAPDASIIGAVDLSADVGIWFGAVLRGDTETIKIGARSNVQEHSMLHTDSGFPLVVGEDCTIGHRAILHGCALGARVLIGMGAIVLNGASVGDDCLVGAGALVTERKTFPSRSLIVGAPAKVVRALTDSEVAGLARSAAHYVENARRFAQSLRPA